MGLQSNWSLELHSNFSMDYLLLTLPVNNVAPLSSDSMISLTFEFSIFSKNWKKKIINNLTCNHCYTYPVHTTPLSGNKEEFPTCIHYFYMKFSTSRKFASASMHTWAGPFYNKSFTESTAWVIVQDAMETTLHSPERDPQGSIF